MGYIRMRAAIDERVKELVSEGKSEPEAIEIAYSEYHKDLTKKG